MGDLTSNWNEGEPPKNIKQFVAGVVATGLMSAEQTAVFVEKRNLKKPLNGPADLGDSWSGASAPTQQ